MIRDAVSAEKRITSPVLAKALSGDGVLRRRWEPGAGGRRPGGTGSAWMNQGLRAYLSLAAALRRR